jgi:thiol-disulfide isomerase/thioredoxin
MEVILYEYYITNNTNNYSTITQKVGLALQRARASSWHVSFSTLASCRRSCRFRRLAFVSVSFAVEPVSELDMRPSLLRLYMRLVALACARSAAASGPGLDLDAESMVAALEQATPLFVKFEAPWCGHCKRLSPVWDSLLELDLNGARLGTVDCTRQEAEGACRRYGVSSYPTLLLFSDGLIKLFSGERSLPELSRYARGGFRQAPDHVPEPLPPSTDEGQQTPRPSALREQMVRTIPPALLRAMDRLLESDSWPWKARCAVLVLTLGAFVQIVVGCYSFAFDRESLRKEDIRCDFINPPKKGGGATGKPQPPQLPSEGKPHAE